MANRVADGLRGARQLSLTPSDRSFFGVVAEIAIGLHLVVPPPYLHLLACVKPGLGRRTLAPAGYDPPPEHAGSELASWRRAPLPQHPGRLYSAASRLANIAILRNDLGRRRTDVDDVTRSLLTSHGRILVNHPSDIWHSRPAFRVFWRSFVDTIAPTLRSLGPASAEVPLYNGRRHADLLLGSTVLEVKTGVLDDPAVLRMAVDQLLTYGLLAHYDGRQVTDLSLYAARYERLLTFGIPDFLECAAGTRVDLTTTAARLAAAIDSE